jgi:hypothetical protein
MALLRRLGFPALWQMASHQAVLPCPEERRVTPLESFHPRPLPSRHRINLMNTDFPVVDLLSFHALVGTHFATLLFSISCRNGGYTPFKTKVFLYLCSNERSHCSPKPFRSNTYTSSHKCSFQRIYSNANFFRCNTYKKTGGRGLEITSHALSCHTARLGLN